MRLGPHLDAKRLRYRWCFTGNSAARGYFLGLNSLDGMQVRKRVGSDIMTRLEHGSDAHGLGLFQRIDRRGAYVHFGRCVALAVVLKAARQAYSDSEQHRI